MTMPACDLQRELKESPDLFLRQRRTELPRHTLVWLKSDSAWTPLAGSPSRLVHEWFCEGRPAVVARRQGDEPAGWLRLGIALAPALGKRRLSLAVHRSCVEDVSAPLSLSEIVDSNAYPADWTAPLHSLRLLARNIGLAPRVFGSFSWQALTRERYVGVGSDIDLVWLPRDAMQVDTLLEMLTQWEQATQRRADGEFFMPDGDAVCWRELVGDSDRLLVKSGSAVALQKRAEVLERFA